MSSTERNFVPSVKKGTRLWLQDTTTVNLVCVTHSNHNAKLGIYPPKKKIGTITLEVAFSDKFVTTQLFTVAYLRGNYLVY